LHANIRLGWAKALDYYDTATITAIKSFIVQAPGAKAIKTNTEVIYFHFRPNYHSNFYNMEITLGPVL